MCLILTIVLYIYPPQVQKQFWFTKSAVIRRLGKKEDEHVVASDAELDAKIELFKAIESSTRTLQVSLMYERGKED